MVKIFIEKALQKETGLSLWLDDKFSKNVEKKVFFEFFCQHAFRHSGDYNISMEQREKWSVSYVSKLASLPCELAIASFDLNSCRIVLG